MSEKSVRHGMLYMFAGTFIVPGMDAVAKHLGTAMSPVQITWGRFFFQVVLMTVVLLMMGRLSSFVPRNPGVHIIRGLLLAIATMLFFWSLNYLPLANAIAIFFVQPMILTLISALFLGEAIGWHRRIAVVCGFLGALLIIRPGTDTFTLAALLPLATAVFFACYLALTRAYSQSESPITLQFFSGLAAMVILSLILTVGHFFASDTALAPIVPSRMQWFWLACIGLIAAVGHLLIVMGMMHAPASVLAPFGYVEIVAATLLGWLIFNELPDGMTVLGILIICVSGIYVFYREQLPSTSSSGDSRPPTPHP